jgi:hypothetical protein
MKTLSLKLIATFADGERRTYGPYVTMTEAKAAKASLEQWDGVLVVDIVPE